MLNRLRDGLIYPKEVLKYVKDNVFLVILYIFMFALLSGTRTVIDTIKYDGISYEFKEEIREELETVDTDCMIVSGNVTCSEAEAVQLYQLMSFTFYIDSNETIDTESYDSLYSFVFHKDKLLVVFSGLSLIEYEISDLPLEFQNIDFGTIQEEDNDAFFEQIFKGVDTYLVDQKYAWGFGVFFVELVMNSLMFFGFILFSGYFLHRRYKMIPFRDSFVLTSYAHTSIFVVLVFYNLLQLPFLLVIILVIIAFRQNNQMIGEIERRLKKPLDK